MNRIQEYKNLKNEIITWLLNHIKENPKYKSFVIGASGSIDSYVTSTLCLETGLPTYILSMPFTENKISDGYIDTLEKKYNNATVIKINLSSIYKNLINCFDFFTSKGEYTSNYLTNENTKSRIRMTILYQVAGNVNGIVVGSGNKIEDYGIGFCTKYGDCGVDIAPIADLYKTEVWNLAKYLKIEVNPDKKIDQNVMWEDRDFNETDDIGVSYEMLEWAMEYTTNLGNLSKLSEKQLTSEQKNAIDVYQKFREKNKHKMNPIPTFFLDYRSINK